MSKSRFGSIRVPADPPSSPSWLAVAILLVVVPPVTTMIGLFLAYKRLRNEITRKQYQQYRRYANTIGNRTEVSIRELAASLGLQTANVVSDLQAMIDQGMMTGNAYIDRSHMRLYLDNQTVETDFVNDVVTPAVTDFVNNVVTPVVNVFVSPEDRAKTVSDARAKQARSSGIPKEADEAPAPEKPRKQAQPKAADSDNFEAKLREIRELNESIADPGVSERIDRIGELTASIFRVVREKPEHAEEVRKFMNYYLPTTLKLLKSYSLMEKQSYQGENIQASRKKIESVLDTLVRGFEQQQDRLFKTEALDVETDISVLETMMASDGLLEQKSGLRAGGGH